jgi:hypothetical protein
VGFLCVYSPGGYCAKVVFVKECCVFWSCSFLVLREVAEEVSMFVAFVTSERYMIIVQGLDPFYVFMGDTYRFW